MQLTPGASEQPQALPGAATPAGAPRVGRDAEPGPAGAPTDRPAGPADLVDQLVADVFDRNCPSRRTLENVTGRWGTLALAALADGGCRFGALRRRVAGISEKMLAQTLHTLERDGLVDRAVLATIPPRVEYTLTPLGARITAKLIELIELVEEQMPAVSAAQLRYDQARGEPRR